MSYLRYLLFVAKRWPGFAFFSFFIVKHTTLFFWWKQFEPRSHFKSRWSHCQQQKSYSALRLPGQSNSTYINFFCCIKFVILLAHLLVFLFSDGPLKVMKAKIFEKIPSTALFLLLLLTVVLSKFTYVRKALLDAILNPFDTAGQFSQSFARSLLVCGALRGFAGGRESGCSLLYPSPSLSPYIFFRCLAFEQGSLSGKLLAGYPLSDFTPHYNLVPRALFPGSKAKEKRPGNEVGRTTLHSRDSSPRKRSFAISTSPLIKPYSTPKIHQHCRQFLLRRQPLKELKN